MTISLFYLQLGTLFLTDINLVSSITPHLIFSEVILASTLPVVFLLISKYSFINAATLTGTLKKLTRLQRNPKVLNALFDGQRSMPIVSQILSSIEFGNQEASNIITIVSNPLCSPCASMHSRMEYLASENKNIKCQVIFLCSDDSKNVGYKFLEQLFSLPLNLKEKALSEWYKANARDFETWLKPYKNYPTLGTTKEVIKSHVSWVNKAEIKSTPTLFLNGKLIPETLKLEDLISFNMSAVNSHKAYQEV
jgi:thiol-disulfide isomerase/thioredoxin